jgi:hypothetical protein
MLVSFLETYMEDVLMGIALKNPQVVKITNMNWARVFEVDSIDELRSELRRNWAHDALRPGGPVTWRQTLSNLGAPKFDQKIIETLRHLWDTRNLIVHSRCIADAAYAKGYAHWGARTGVKVVVNLKVHCAWSAAVKDLVQWTDAFFLAYGGTAKKPAVQGAGLK